MKFKMSWLKVLCVLLIVFLLNSCYRNVVLPRDQPVDTHAKILKLIWLDPGVEDIYMVDNMIEEGNIKGIVHSSLGYKPPAKKTSIIDLYINPNFAPPDSFPSLYTLSMDQIQRIEVYDTDVGKTILAVAGSVVAVAGIVTLIVLLTKDSCPFVYVHNGDSYEFTGEIYSGAIFPYLERHDYLPLPQLKPVNNEYKIKIANLVKEIQYTNLTELILVEHPETTEVLVDKYGECHTFADIQIPLRATNSLQKDVLTELSCKDSLKYIGDINEDVEEDKDFVILEFDKPEDVDTAKLLLRAKNSFWLDHIFREFFTLFGDKYANWYDKQRNLSEGNDPNWSLEQGIPLSIYLEKNGVWEFIDYYNIIGPVAEKDVIMPIDISDIGSENLKVKLEYGYLFWELDFVGIDFTPDLEVKERVISLNKAIDEESIDVSNLLLQDDEEYYTMDEVGDKAEITFSVPTLSNASKYSVFLHSKGHYEVIRDPDGAPDISYLRSFQKPGQFGKFSKEKFLELNEQIGINR